MNVALEMWERLSEDFTSKDNDSCCSITNFLVLLRVAMSVSGSGFGVNDSPASGETSSDTKSHYFPLA